VRGSRAGKPLAIIDVGSNSGRVVVLQLGPEGHLELLADGRSPLRLARDVVRGSRLSAAAIQRTIGALRDFRAIATGAGAGTIVAVATSAVRSSSNAGQLLDRIREETGLDVRLIDGEQEARCAFLGALAELPQEHGWVADIGGGSVELTQFRNREAKHTATFPLGSLSMSDRFLSSDPPDPDDVRDLCDFVRTSLSDAEIPAMEPDEQLIGTGGTIRNLAKIDHRSRAYPIPRLHGFVVSRRRVDELADMLARKRASRRASVRGLNRDRADSIVGGALVTRTVMEVLDAPSMVVSGQGLREGIVYESLGRGIPTPDEARASSLRALVARFSTWDPARAERRTLIASRLHAALDPEAGPRWKERIEHAATLLDIGRSIDFYERYRHAADIIVASDLAGFTHRKLALLAAVVRQGGDASMNVRQYGPLLGPQDAEPVARASAILELADEIEHRSRPDQVAALDVRELRRTIVINAPVFDAYRQDVLASRIQQAFARRIAFEPLPG
jgi:exopolyphosphatase/guanosine-5'-triphosphate,3'-diphosphate pyrophosphatase